MAEEFARHTPEEWLERVPTLERVGHQLQGPCPLCGGTDRFHVNLEEPHLFGCRQCEDGPAILAKIFDENTPSDSQKRPSDSQKRPSDSQKRPSDSQKRPSDSQKRPSFHVATYTTAPGRQTNVHRKDWPQDWNGQPCNWTDCKWGAKAHKHIWKGKGEPTRGLLLLLWEPNNPLDKDLLVICEGEKAAEAVRNAGYIGVSYCGGTSAANKADYSPVAGRPVLVWPDADRVGIKAGKEVVERAHMAEAFEVRTVEVLMAEGQDAADYGIPEIRRRIEETQTLEALTAPDVGQGVQGAPTKGAHSIEADEHGLKTILEYLRLELRENPRNLRTEIRRIGTDAEAAGWAKQWASEMQPDYWIPMSDAIEASLHQVSREHFTFWRTDKPPGPAIWTDRDFGHALLNNCPRPPKDPFVTWLETLPEWDGEKRIERLWIDTLDMPDTELTREGGRRFLIGAVRRAYEPGCVHDWIPLLVGPQGLGKSSVLRELVSPSKDWFSDSTQLDGTPKERMETTGPAVITEYSEMAGLDRASAASFKTYLSQTADQLRPAYGRYAQRTPRRWVGVGTANPDPDGVLPGDSTGARRYVIMSSRFDALNGDKDTLKHAAQQARQWVKDRLDQLWAEAWHEYRDAKRRKDEHMNMIGHLRNAQERAAEGFQRHFEGLREIAYQLTAWGQEYEKRASFGPTIAELMVQAGLSETEGMAAKDRSTQIALARELTAAGWAKKQKQVARVSSWRWFPPFPQDAALVNTVSQPRLCVITSCRRELTPADAAPNGSLEFVNTCRRHSDKSGGTGASPDGADPAGAVVQGEMREALLLRLGEMEAERAGRVASIRDTLDHEGLQELTQALFALRCWMNSHPDIILRPEHIAGSESRLVALVERIARQNWHMVDASYDWTPLTLDLRAVADQYLERSLLEPREKGFSDVLRRWFQPPLMSIEGVQGATS